MVESWNTYVTSCSKISDMVSTLNDVILICKSSIIIYNVFNFLTPTWFFSRLYIKIFKINLKLIRKMKRQNKRRYVQCFRRGILHLRRFL